MPEPAPSILRSSERTQRFLAQFGGRVVLYLLTPYCHDDNRIERVWFNRCTELDPSLGIAVGVSQSRSAVQKLSIFHWRRFMYFSTWRVSTSWKSRITFDRG